METKYFLLTIIAMLLLVNCTNNKSEKTSYQNFSKNREVSRVVSSTFNNVIDKFPLIDSAVLDYNKILLHEIDNFNHIPDSIISKLQLKKFGGTNNDLIEYRYYKRLNFNKSFISLIYYRTINDTSELTLANYSKSGKLIDKIAVCSNWGDYGRLGSRITHNGNLYIDKYVMGKEHIDNLSLVDSKHIYTKNVINMFNGKIEKIETELEDITLKITDSGYVVKKY